MLVALLFSFTSSGQDVMQTEGGGPCPVQQPEDVLACGSKGTRLVLTSALCAAFVSCLL